MFYLAQLPGGGPILTYQQNTDAPIFSYVPNTGLFHEDDVLTTDFFFEQEMTFTPISPEAAHNAISKGTGRFDERRHQHIVETYRAHGESRSPAEVFADSPAADLPPRMHAARIAARVAATEPGVWVTYRHYPDGQEQRAHASAYDIRAGKVKAFTFTVDARVVPSAAGGRDFDVTRTTSDPTRPQSSS